MNSGFRQTDGGTDRQNTSAGVELRFADKKVSILSTLFKVHRIKNLAQCSEWQFYIEIVCKANSTSNHFQGPARSRGPRLKQSLKANNWPLPVFNL